MMTPSKELMEERENLFFELMEVPSPKIMVLGEDDEQWSQLVCDFFRRSEVDYYFFRWNEIPAARLSLELVRMPVTQCWANGQLLTEVVGYRAEELKQFLLTYRGSTRRKI
jgi:hypothetical protein